jgi:hypothetical protein
MPFSRSWAFRTALDAGEITSRVEGRQGVDFFARRAGRKGGEPAASCRCYLCSPPPDWGCPAADGQKRGEEGARPCVSTAGTDYATCALTTTTPSTAAGAASGLAQHVERKADVVSGKINRADTIAAAREEIASLATTRKLAARSRPPPLRNCRRIVRQASERRDPGMTGRTLGDCPAGPRPSWSRSPRDDCSPHSSRNAHAGRSRSSPIRAGARLRSWRHPRPFVGGRPLTRASAR